MPKVVELRYLRRLSDIRRQRMPIILQVLIIMELKDQCN